MTMVLDPQSRQYGGMGYDGNMYSSMHTAPNFTDPWAHQTSNHANRSSMPMQYQPLAPPTSQPATSGSHYSRQYDGASSLSYPQDAQRPNVSYPEQQYSSPATSGSTYSTSYPSMNYAQSLHHQQAQQQRKLSDVNDSRAANASFGELDASRGMLALSHSNLQDLTPRNIYEARARASTDSYGFPPSASGHSSISAESGRGYPYYSGSSVSGSVADSATDYSSAASDAGYDSMAARTLPRPQQMMPTSLGPPAPQSMMGQFSSKMSGNTQKKHKCKVCDKRFTRPSSLQTHMYSHTGEKPFACDVEGCGRHFSVVSNLRRHKKVHKGEGASVSSVSDGEDNHTSS